MSKKNRDEKLDEMAKAAGVPLDNVYQSEDELAKVHGGKNAEFIDSKRWDEIVDSQPPISEETLQRLRNNPLPDEDLS